MFSSLDNVNDTVNYARGIIKQIDHINGMDDSLSDIKTLMFAAMLDFYGMKHVDEIYLAFLRTDFILCDDLCDTLSEKYGLSYDYVLKLIEHCPGTFYAVDAVKDLKTNKYKFKRSIYISDKIGTNTLIRSLTHQVNHVINSFNRPVLKKNGDYVSRMGISVEHFGSRRTEVLGLEEAINDFQTEDILKCIKRFSDDEITDLGVKRLLDSFTFDGLLQNDKNTLFSEIVEPLYTEKLFNESLIKGRFSGDLASIRNCFDAVVGNGSFGCLLAFCDKLEKLDNSSSQLEYEEEKAKCLVKRYVDNCK